MRGKYARPELGAGTQLCYYGGANGGYLKNTATRLGIALILIAIVWFGSGIIRTGALLLRANVGIYEALIVAVIGIVVLLSSRRK